MTSQPVVYVRISPRGANATDTSVERQWLAGQEYCKREGLGEPLPFVDVDASGSNDRRERWRELLQRVRKGHVTCIVAYDQDRLFRDEEQAAQFIKLLERHPNVRLHFVLSGRVDLASADAVTMFHFKSTMNAHASRKAAERTKHAMAALRSQGRKTGGTAPYGWDSVAGKLVANAYQQQVLAWMRSMVAAGHGSQAIATALNTARIPSKTGNTWWSRATVHAIITRLAEATGAGRESEDG